MIIKINIRNKDIQRIKESCIQNKYCIIFWYSSSVSLTFYKTYTNVYESTFISNRKYKVEDWPNDQIKITNQKDSKDYFLIPKKYFEEVMKLGYLIETQ